MAYCHRKTSAFPVGRPQTVTVDLTGKFLSPSREVRIVTSMRIFGITSSILPI